MNMPMEAEKNKKTIAAKFFIFVGIAALVATAIFLGKELYRKRQIQNEISSLQTEASRISRENLQIKDKITYLESSDYQQREAKDKLNLQGPDENVVVIKPSVAKNQPAAAENIQSAPLPVPEVPNPKKWWDYFFKY